MRFRSPIRSVASAAIVASASLWAVAFNAQAQSVVKGAVVIPQSSIERPEDVGVRSHTNIMFLGDPRKGKGHQYGGGPGGGYTPANIEAYYNLPSTGGSQIVAIVDAFDNPNALSDFNFFSNAFGLPTESSSSVTASTNRVFQVVYASGTKPGVDSTGGWELEESLDVQWAHAMAPNAKIVLVEATTNSNANLYAAEDVATNYVDGNGLRPKEISNSWGGSESRSETSSDSHFNHTGAAYFASAGDSGTPAQYPSSSPYIISAGGTTINSDPAGNFLSETAWSWVAAEEWGGGGGPSADELRPSFQNAISAIVGTKRGTPDISSCSDPETGVSVYDTYPYEGTPYTWWIVGGTSAASPTLAGIANNAATTQGFFPAGSQALLASIYYSLGNFNFRDIVAGQNQLYYAGPGWDFCTGVGTPQGIGGFEAVTDVSTSVEVQHGVFLYSRASTAYTQVLTLTNTGATTINGPISLILGSLTDATLTNASGTTSVLTPTGRPYINLAIGSLAPGASTTVGLVFDKTGPTITFTTDMVAGSGSR